MAETEARPKKRFRLKRKLIAAVLLVAVVGGAFFFGAVWSHRDTAPKITSDLISQQLTEVQELATVEYFYTNVGRFENKLDFYGWQVPFTTKRFIVSYDGIIKAGVDLSGLKVEVNGKNVTVTLPQAKILSHEIPEDSIEVFDETHNIFNQIEISDYTGFTADQRGEIEQKAIDNGFLDRAQETAKSVVENLVGMMPGMESYTVTVK